LFALLVL